MRLKKRLLAFSRQLHARIRKTSYMHKMRCLLINRRSLLLALRLLWKTPIFPSNSRLTRTLFPYTTLFRSVCYKDLALDPVQGPTTTVLWRRSEEHTSELQSRQYLVCGLLLEKKYERPGICTK